MLGEIRIRHNGASGYIDHANIARHEEPRRGNGRGTMARRSCLVRGHRFAGGGVERGDAVVHAGIPLRRRIAVPFLRDHEMGWDQAFGFRTQSSKAIGLGLLVALGITPVVWGLQLGGSELMHLLGWEPVQQAAVDMLRATESASILVVMAVRGESLPTRGELREGRYPDAPQPRGVLAVTLVLTVGAVLLLEFGSPSWRSALITSMVFALLYWLVFHTLELKPLSREKFEAAIEVTEQIDEELWR